MRGLLAAMAIAMCFASSGAFGQERVDPDRVTRTGRQHDLPHQTQAILHLKAPLLHRPPAVKQVPSHARFHLQDPLQVRVKVEAPVSLFLHT